MLRNLMGAVETTATGIIALAASCAEPREPPKYSVLELTSAECDSRGCNVEPGSDDVWRAHADGHGVYRQLEATFDQAWAAAHAVIHWDHAGTPIDYRGDDGEAYAITDVDSYENAQIGIWVDPMNVDKVMVSVVVLSPDVYLVGAPNEAQVQDDVAKAVALLKAGKPLPQARP